MGMCDDGSGKGRSCPVPDDICDEYNLCVLPVWKAARQNGESPETTTNKDYAAALWDRLDSRGNQAIPVKTDWVAVSKRRLNAALKHVQHCA